MGNKDDAGIFSRHGLDLLRKDAVYMSIGDLNENDLDDLVGRELDGRYLLDKFVDRGGFGAVYRGIDKKFNLPVAVKVGLSHREFMKEAKLAAEVRHDNIVQVTDYGNDHGLAYLVMEFLEGEDLERLFRRQGNKLTVDEMRQFVTQVGDALSHAHADKLIHRDLKPRNIILKESGKRTQTSDMRRKFVLLDFGIAAKLDAEGTQRNRTQDGAGTIEYMAPELLKVNPTATQQSDIYAFGILMYQMLVGRVPFPQSDVSHVALAEMVYTILHSPPPSFAHVAPDRSFPSGVETLVRQCLEKDPAKRPQTIEEVRDRFLKVFHPPRTERRVDFSGTLRPGEVGSATGDSQRPSMRPMPQPAARSAKWPWIAAVLGISVGIGVAFTQKPTETEQIPYAELTTIRGGGVTSVKPDETIEMVAGDSVSVTMAIENLQRNVVVDFTQPTLTGGIQAEEKEGPVPGHSKTYVFSVGNLNSVTNQPSVVEFRAATPDSSYKFEKKITLQVQRPKPWLPDSLRALGYQESSDSRLCKIGQTTFASILERKVAGNTFRFRLVPAKEIKDRGRTIKTFYIMEKVVSKALFREFAKQMSDFELKKRSIKERKWESGNNDEPVTEIYVLEAQQFARWFGGQLGGLPSAGEWELAAGYYDFLEALETKFHRNPSDIHSEELQRFRAEYHLPVLDTDVSIGLGPTQNEIRDPRSGAVEKDCSIYGCQYAQVVVNIDETRRVKTRLTEMTSTLRSHSGAEHEFRALFRDTIPTKDHPKLTDQLLSALLRGSGRIPGPGEQGSVEIEIADDFQWVVSGSDGLRVRTAEDLDEAGSISLLPDSLSLANDTGFRIALTVEMK